jgi:hypothetical protein
MRRNFGFHLQKAPNSKSCGFKSSEYGGQSAGVQNFANNCWVALVVWTGAKFAERHIFHQNTSSALRDHMLSLKLLVDVSINMCASENWPSAA